MEVSILSRRDRWVPLLGVALGCAFLWIALRNTSFTEIGQALTKANPLYILPVLLLIHLSYWIRSYRWALLLRPVAHASTGDVYPITMVGSAANTLLPARLGELVRTVLMGRRLGASKSSVLGTVALERMFDFLIVLALLSLAGLLVPELPPELHTARLAVGVVSISALAFTSAYVLWTPRFLRVVERLLALAPASIREKVLEQLQRGAEGLASLKSPRLLILQSSAAVAQWTVQAGVVYLAVAAVGIDAPPGASLIVLGILVAGVSLPNAPGFLGTIQLCFTIGLAPFAVPAASALAASVFYHSATFGWTVSLGLYHMRKAGIRLTGVSGEGVAPAMPRSDGGAR